MARCYCGAVEMRISAPPLTVAYCHCGDCRRRTGAVVPAFAAFAASAMPDLGPPLITRGGVSRWACARCASPVAATFDYLPGQVYVPLGLFEDLAPLAPQVHCHAERAPSWLHLDDRLPHQTGSARDVLNASTI